MKRRPFWGVLCGAILSRFIPKSKAVGRKKTVRHEIRFDVECAGCGVTLPGKCRPVCPF